VRKVCAVCSEPFEAKRNTAKYCSKRCNVRAARQPKPERHAAPLTADPPPPVPSLLAATLAELERAGSRDSAAGAAALALAARVDAGGGENGAGLAALVREHRSALSAALDRAAPPADPVEDELRTARERRRALAGG
jgi:hypothetical protein